MADPHADDVSGRDVPSRLAVPRALEIGASWSWRLLVVGVTVLAIAWAAIQLRLVILPLFVAVLLTAMLAPLVERAARRMPRLLATWIVMLAALCSFVALFALVSVVLAGRIDDARDQIDLVTAEVRDWLETGPLDLGEERVDQLVDSAGTWWDDVVSGFSEQPASAVRAAAELIGGAFLSLVMAFFLLHDGPRMWVWTINRLRPVRRDSADRAGRAAFASLQGWLRGVAITGVVDAVVIGLALVVLGVPAAIPLAIVTFFGAFFPIVGATIAGALAVAVALVSNGVATAVAVGVIVLAVQQIEGDVLLPVVMRRQVRLHPLVILVVLAGGAALGGIIGAVLAVPVTAALTAAASVIAEPAAATADRASSTESER